MTGDPPGVRRERPARAEITRNIGVSSRIGPRKHATAVRSAERGAGTQRPSRRRWTAASVQLCMHAGAPAVRGAVAGVQTVPRTPLAAATETCWAAWRTVLGHTPFVGAPRIHLGSHLPDVHLMRRSAALLVVVLALLVVTAPPAAAHAALVSSEPAAGYSVIKAPEAVVLNFSQPVTLVGDALLLRTAEGRPVALDALLDPGGAILRGLPRAELAAGGYVVQYRVVARDGDVISGSFPFGVSTPVQVGRSGGDGAVAADDPGQVQWRVALLRALLLLGLSVALGGVVGAGTAAWATGGLPGVRPLLRSGSLIGLLGAAGLLIGLAPGGWSELRDAVTAPGAGRLLTGEVLLFALAALTARGPAHNWVATVALVGIVGLEGIRAHPGEAVGGAGVALTVVHLAAAALWLGGLVHVLRLAVRWRASRSAMRCAVTAYARMALALLLLLFGTGTLSALLLLPTLEDWTGTPYGRVLLVKLAIFMTAVAAAGLARLRIRRPTRAASGVGQLGGAARVEAGLLVGVVIVTAALTSATPARLVPASSLLVAPTGPALRVAERVGQVSVGVVAFEGRLEVRVTAPDDGRPVEYELAVHQSSPSTSRPAAALSLDSCGTDCWTGDARWREGVNRLTVDVTAVPWTGGTVTVDVPWPLTPAPQLLQRVQEVMGAQDAIDMRESVTSGFGPPTPRTFRETGQEYLERQAWSQGGAVDAVVIAADGERTLAFALPAMNYHFQMRLDDQDRIVSERIVTRTTLLQRDYAYPSPDPPPA